MCIHTIINFYCLCPHRDRTCCPHENYVRSAADRRVLPTTPEPTGFYLRRVGDYQRCTRWEPIRQSWQHCSTFTNNPNLTNPRQCPETLAAGASHMRIRQQRALCEQCLYGHHPEEERRNPFAPMQRPPRTSGPEGRRNAITSETALIPTTTNTAGREREDRVVAVRPMSRIDLRAIRDNFMRQQRERGEGN